MPSILSINHLKRGRVDVKLPSPNVCVAQYGRAISFKG